MAFKQINEHPHGWSQLLICCDCHQEYELSLMAMVRRTKFLPCPTCQDYYRLSTDGGEPKSGSPA